MKPNPKDRFSNFKKRTISKTPFLLAAYILLSAYDPYYYEEEYAYTPIVITRSTLESAVELQNPRELEDPGRIYLKDNYIFIVERYKGIHVINNSNPSNPVNEKFIRIPGCLNMAIKNEQLFADNSVDLISINISDLSNITVSARLQNTFPEFEMPDHSYIPWEYEKENRPENTVIVGFEKN